METNKYMVKIDDGRLFLLSPAEGKRVLDIIVFTNAKEVNFQVESGGLMEFKTDKIERVYPIDELGNEIVTKKDGKVFILDDNGMYEQGSAEDLKYNYTSEVINQKQEAFKIIKNIFFGSLIWTTVVLIVFFTSIYIVEWQGFKMGLYYSVAFALFVGAAFPKIRL